MPRQATQEDFIRPEFIGCKPDEYEVREDGKIVRKDRWQNGVQSIRVLVGIPSRADWEIDDVVDRVMNLAFYEGRNPEDCLLQETFDRLLKNYDDTTSLGQALRALREVYLVVKKEKENMN